MDRENRETRCTLSLERTQREEKWASGKENWELDAKNWEPGIDQRTNGPVNAHLISWPSKAQNIQNLKNIW